MSWYSFRPYVSAGERRLKAEAAAKKLAKNGHTLAPVQIQGRTIAATFWGKSWCENLESYSDYSNRLPRGRTYVRNGSVVDLQISKGQIQALVQGSSLYKVSIEIKSLGDQRWQSFKQSCAGKLTNLLDLLQGRLSKEILENISAQGTGLFPSPKEITLKCSCPDWAEMCKHVAAVLYGVGARLDSNPEMFFTLRGVDMQDLIAAASHTVVAPGSSVSAADDVLTGASLSDIFGVEIDLSSEAKREAQAPVPAKPSPAEKKGRKSGASSKKASRKVPAATAAKPKKRPSARAARKK